MERKINNSWALNEMENNLVFRSSGMLRSVDLYLVIYFLGQPIGPETSSIN